MPTAATPSARLTAATMPTGTRRVRRGSAVACLCVEGLQAHGVGCARPFRREHRRLQGNSCRVRRCRHHRRGSRRQTMPTGTRRVRARLTASKGYRLTAESSRRNRRGSRRRQCRQDRGANVAACWLPVSASMPTGTRRNRRGCAVACFRVEGLQAHGVGLARPFRRERRRLQGNSCRVRRCRHHRRGSRRQTMPTGTRRVRLCGRLFPRRRATGSRRGLGASVPARTSAAWRR